jgi:U3 small nucleolar RNA-associated protein 13
LGENESHIAVATNSPNIKVFEISTSNCYILKGHSDIVLSLDTFPKDAYTLISSSKDNTVRVWKFSTTFTDGICYFYGSGHTHSVTAIATPHFQTSFFVSGSEDTTLKIWKIPKQVSSVSLKPDIGIPLTARLTQHAHEKTINSVTISPNDQLIASGSQDKTAKIWSVDELKLLGVIRGHRKGIWCLQFSPVDQVLVTSSADATIKIWALTDYSCLKTFQGHDCSVLKVMFIDRGMQFISSATDGNIKIWNLKNNECVKTIDAHNDKIWALTKSNDENLLITGGSDSLILIWNDVTVKEKEEMAVKQENQVKSEQTLLNLMHKKKWSKALKLAIRLDHPFRALSIIKETLIETNGFNEIDNILLDLREDQLLSLLDYALIWNTNSKHYIVSQCVLKAVFKKIPSKEFIKTPDIKQKIEKLMPYTERHLNRLTRLQQYVTFVDFVWEQIKLPQINTNDLNVSMNSISIDNINENIEDLSGTEYITLNDSDDESD